MKFCLICCSLTTSTTIASCNYIVPPLNFNSFLHLSNICLCLFFLSIDEPNIIFPYFCVLKSHFTDMNVLIQGMEKVNILTIKFLLLFLHWFYAGTSRCCPLSDCMYGCARQSQSERQRDGSDRTCFSEIQFNIYCVLF